MPSPGARPETSLGLPRNLVRLYAGMTASLEKLLGGDTLGELFARVRASGESRSLPLDEDEDVWRFLRRLGILDGRTKAEATGKLVEGFVREVAEAVGRSPAPVSLVVKLYAAGLYGILARPICGSPPRCRECGLTKDCDYHNAPPRRSPNQSLPPAKRLAREGVEAVSDAELLALIMGGARPAKAQSELARSLLQRFGSLRGLAAASYGELASLRGVSQAAALRLTAAAAYHARAVVERRASGPVVRSGKDFYDLYHQSLRDLRQEVFLVILLDQKNRILREVKTATGTLTASLVHPREVFRPAIREAAAAVAFVHNHPSGDCTPSADDKALTERLCETANLVGIRVLDHVIIGEGAYTSFVDEGLLQGEP